MCWALWCSRSTPEPLLWCSFFFFCFFFPFYLFQTDLVLGSEKQRPTFQRAKHRMTKLFLPAQSEFASVSIHVEVLTYKL